MIHFSYFFMSFIVAPSVRDGRKRWLDPIETGEAGETRGHSSSLANNLNFKGPTVVPVPPPPSSDFVPQRKSALRGERDRGRTLVLLFNLDGGFFPRKASRSIACFAASSRRDARRHSYVLVLAEIRSTRSPTERTIRLAFPLSLFFTFSFRKSDTR